MKPELKPTLPLSILSNQYGYSPCKTYYYIVDVNGLIFHQDNKWRKNPLKNIKTHVYRTEMGALTAMGYLTRRFKTN